MIVDGAARALAVAVVLLRADGHTLLVRRAPGRPAAGYWTPVTGKVEVGETPRAAGAREVLEEVGLVVDMGREIYRCPTEGAPFDLVWHTARLRAGDEGRVLVPSAEIAEARWLLPAEAARLEPMFAVTAAFYRGDVGQLW